MIWYEGILFFWVCAGITVNRLGFKSGEILQSAAFVFITNNITTLIHLPVSIYNHFVLEEKHGFNKQVSKVFQKYCYVLVSYNLNTL